MEPGASWAEQRGAKMAKDKDLIAQRRKASAQRNGRVKRPNQLRLLASRHVLRKVSRGVRPSNLF